MFGKRLKCLRPLNLFQIMIFFINFRYKSIENLLLHSLPLEFIGNQTENYRFFASKFLLALIFVLFLNIRKEVIIHKHSLRVLYTVCKRFKLSDNYILPFRRKFHFYYIFFALNFCSYF